MVNSNLDIVERLRNHFDSMCMNNIVCGDAADEIERLRRWKAYATTVLKNWDCWAEQGIALLGAIDTLHQPVRSGKGDEVCNDCACFWPCQTHLLLHPEGGPS